MPDVPKHGQTCLWLAWSRFPDTKWCKTKVFFLNLMLKISSWGQNEVSPSGIAGFFDRQYFWKESVSVLQGKQTSDTATLIRRAQPSINLLRFTRQIIVGMLFFPVWYTKIQVKGQYALVQLDYRFLWPSIAPKGINRYVRFLS